MLQYDPLWLRLQRALDVDQRDNTGHYLLADLHHLEGLQLPQLEKNGWTIVYGSSFSKDQRDVFFNYSFSGITTDVWTQAKTFVDYLNSHTLFNTGAYSIIMS